MMTKKIRNKIILEGGFLAKVLALAEEIESDLKSQGSGIEHAAGRCVVSNLRDSVELASSLEDEKDQRRALFNCLNRAADQLKHLAVGGILKEIL